MNGEEDSLLLLLEIGRLCCFEVHVDGGGEAFPEGGVADAGHFVWRWVSFFFGFWFLFLFLVLVFSMWGGWMDRR
jgi:hypothetical protein